MKYNVEKHGVYHGFKIRFRCECGCVYVANVRWDMYDDDCRHYGCHCPECGRPNTSREKVQDNDD